MALRNAYVKLRRGGYQEVVGYDNVLYEDQEVDSGWYRDLGWVPVQVPVYEVVTTDGIDAYNVSRLTPATGSDSIPDNMAEAGGDATAAPRQLTWQETRLSFRTAANVVIAQFWVINIMGYSDTAPNIE